VDETGHDLEAPGVAVESMVVLPGHATCG
jgi:hypothetical protein